MTIFTAINLKMLSMASAVSLSSNLDNIAIGTSMGFRRIGLRPRDNLVVATVTTAGTIASAAAGKALTQIIPDNIESMIGGAIMLLVGLWIIYQEKTKPEPVYEDADAGSTSAAAMPADTAVSSGSRMTLSELLTLSLGLTLNNIPNGVGAGMLHIDIVLLGLLNFIASLATLSLGVHVGRRGVRWLGTYSGYVAGVLLAALGATEMVF
ncbi:hypothetical protein [Rhizobium sp. C1]|uniref:hypothetical protein n=1 Tax=Rhizobium sp. C1 TaxID=1349799 RepID=UPI001E45D18B|nr:hypothetical protein [Rhizobium sp. C1]MCD2178825.1 hypothetical protein [Rhizobium sp. C1]